MPSYYGSAIYGVSTYNANVPNNLTTLDRLDIYTGTHDEIHILARELSELEILQLLEDVSVNYTVSQLQALTVQEASQLTVEDLIGVRQRWNADTVFLASFEGNLEAGSISLGDVEINKWRLKRQREGSNIVVTVGEFNVLDYDIQISWIDRNLWSKRNYVYFIVPVGTDGTEGEQLSVVTSVTFDGWILTDPDNQNNFVKFYYNIDSVSIQLEEDRTELRTFYKYPLVRYGEGDFHRGSISSLYIPEDQTVIQQIEALKTLLRLRKALLLKDGKGVNYLVNAHSQIESRDINDIDPSRISIQWVEVGETGA